MMYSGFQDFEDDYELQLQKANIRRREKLLSMTPQKIKELLDEKVIGQDEAKKTLAVSIYKHYFRMIHEQELIQQNKQLEKSNIILTGLSGSGKTLLLKTVAEILDVPIFIADCTAFTEAGYVGEDVENCLTGLLRDADYDVERAEMGIVVLDEIDKVCRKGENVSVTRDVSGEGVQQALLKIVEGGIVNVPPEGGRKHPQSAMIAVDTKNILFVGLGAFEGIEETCVKERLKKQYGVQKIGFNVENSLSKADLDKKSMRELRSMITKEDLIKFGMMPEFMGRFPLVRNLSPLGKEDLVKILKMNNHFFAQYKTIFELSGKKLIIDEDVYEAIADRALCEKTGARELQSIVDNIMEDVVYNMPSDNLKKYCITKESLIDKIKTA